MTSIRNPQKALEKRCGNGNGAKLIKKYFSPKNIIGIDLDEKMVKMQKHIKRINKFSDGIMTSSNFKTNL